MTLTFFQVKKSHKQLICKWLLKPHVRDYFYGQGLQNTFDDLEKWVEKDSSRFSHFVAFENEVPFGYLMTSLVTEDDVFFKKWKTEGEAITLDLLIGEESYLGRGLGSRMITEFLVDQFPHIAQVFIDPEVRNTRAIHVYEKAGFVKLEQFIPNWDPVAHWLMHKL